MFNFYQKSITCLFLLGCTSLSTCIDDHAPPTSDLYDVFYDIEVEEDTYAEDCYQKQWWFCPPLGAVWQMEVTLDICTDPPQVISVGECKEVFECDPTIFLQGERACFADEGYPGDQKIYCNKGHYEYGDCVSLCEEEVCDYKDNDCDDKIDEGQLNTCGACGVVPSEVCDGIDNDCDGATDEDLVQQCFTDCGTGIEYCDEGNWISCTAQQPTPELCDGIDNDCDGSIDEDIECACTIEHVGTLFPCTEDPLLCGQGFKTCLCEDDNCSKIVLTPCYAACYFYPPQGEVCDPFVGLEIEEESCNNFDDNCNQLIDENLISGCYTGPAGTVNVGICTPGEVVCQEGTWGNDKDGIFQAGYCEGETLPEENDHCNGVDDNCDGDIDDGKELTDTDILFVVDWSGSMSQELSAVVQALGLFAAYYSDETVVKWALVAGPTKGLLPAEQKLYLKSDLVSFSQFTQALGASPPGPQGSMEMLLDAIFLSLVDISGGAPLAKEDVVWAKKVVSTPPIKDFKLSWREDSKKVIIVFTDEPPQSFLIPPLNKETIIQTSQGVPKLKIYTFTTDFSGTSPDWKEISSATGGGWYELSLDVLTMYFNLVEILDENICE